MSERREAIIITTGMDNTSLSPSITELRTQMVALAKSIKAGIMPVDMPPEVLSYYRKLGQMSGTAFSKGQAETARVMQAARDASIAAGAIPAGWAEKKAENDVLSNLGYAGGSIAGGYVFSASGSLAGKLGPNGELVKAAEVAGKGLASVGRHAGALSTVIRETVVMFREGMRGNTSRMFGSFTILLAALGNLTSALISGIPIIGTAVAAFLGMKTTIKKMDAAIDQSIESEKSLGESQTKIKKQLEEQINAMVQYGKMDVATGRDLLRLTAGGSLRVVQERLRRMFPHGLPQAREMEEANRLDQQIRDKTTENTRQQLDAQGKLTYDLVRAHAIKENMALFDKDSVEYKRLELQYLEAQHEVQADQAALEKQKTEEANKQAEKQKEIDRLMKELHANVRSQAKEVNAEQKHDLFGMPTLEEAAGRGFARNLQARYGRWLGAPIAGMARDYMRQQAGMALDFERFSLRTGGDYAAFLATGQGAGEKNLLNKLGAPLKALGVVQDTDLAGRLDDLKSENAQIVKALAVDGIIIGGVKD